MWPKRVYSKAKIDSFLTFVLINLDVPTQQSTEILFFVFPIKNFKNRLSKVWCKSKITEIFSCLKSNMPKGNEITRFIWVFIVLGINDFVCTATNCNLLCYTLEEYPIIIHWYNYGFVATSLDVPKLLISSTFDWFPFNLVTYLYF